MYTSLKQIEFAYIAPRNCITPPKTISQQPFEWLTQQPFHLLLAHLLDQTWYADFYKSSQPGRSLKILDNGAFERHVPMSMMEIGTLITESGVKPNVVVLPDYPFETGARTVDAAEKVLRDGFSPQARDGRTLCPNFMVVPQSKEGDWQDWVSTYCTLLRIALRSFSFDREQFRGGQYISHIGMSILGIPNAFKSITGTDDILINRVFATQFLLNNPESRDLIAAAKGKIKHHYLGLGQPREILLQRQLGLIDSNDSSSPIWHGLQGIAYDRSWGGLINGKSPVPVDFSVNYALTANMVDTINSNIALIDNLVTAPYLESLSMGERT